MTPEEFYNILASAPEPIVQTFKLYYNEHGRPIVYTMEQLPGNYIEVDQDTYLAASMNVQVINGKIKILEPEQYFPKLTHSDTGTKCDPRDVCVVVDDEELQYIKWSIINGTN